MKLKMQGVYTALITPFDSKGNICHETAIQHLHLQHKSGIDAVVLFGTTGEPSTVEESERSMLIKVAVNELKGKMPIMVGCGAPSTKKTVEMAKAAFDLGADAIQIIAPYLNKPTQEGLFLHYQEIARSIQLPICIYNVPGRTSINIEIDTLERIAEFPNIIGVKECNPNFQQITDIVERICHKRPDFSLFSGDDPMTLPMMAVGAHGIMSVISNLIPGAMVRFVQAIQAGNIVLARALHYAMKPLLQAVSLETNPIPIKYLMQLANLDTGILRLPLTTASPAAQEKLRHYFEACRDLVAVEEALGATR